MEHKHKVNGKVVVRNGLSKDAIDAPALISLCAGVLWLIACLTQFIYILFNKSLTITRDDSYFVVTAFLICIIALAWLAYLVAYIICLKIECNGKTTSTETVKKKTTRNKK